MSIKGKYVAVAGMLLSGLWFYVQLRAWQDRGQDYMPLVLNAILTVSLWFCLGYAYIFYRRQGIDAEKRQARADNALAQQLVESQQRVKALQSELTVQAERLEREKYDSIARAMRVAAEHVREARSLIAVSGAYEVLADQASYLCSELSSMLSQDEHESAATKKGWKYPMDRDIVSAAHGEPWSWQHRAWSAWQSMFRYHRTTVLKFRAASFESTITEMPEKEYMEADNIKLSKALASHAKSLAEAEAAILKAYDSATG